MQEEQLKAAETDKVEAQVEDAVEEISEDDLDGVVGCVETDAAKEEEQVVEEISEDDLAGVTGGANFIGENPTMPLPTCCGHDPCLGLLAGCNSETTAD